MRVRTNEAIDLEPTDGADWKAIDSALRTIVRRRGALDALEAKWIREAVRVKIWREVGCVNMADYLERRLGYAPRTGYDRVRVAMALEELPKLATALASGLPHSAVRALTRVCTNDNEQRWLDEVRGKSVHEIENMVSGRRRGSDPEDPVDPSLVGKTLPFEGIRPATEALVRDARRALQEERGPGEVLSDDDVLAAFARMVLEARSGERTKAPYQIAVGLCERCGCGWQESGGRKYALSKADTERACCDAQWIGLVDDGAPDRATQDVPPSVRRMVHRRARGRCEIPGCRSTRCLEIHHIVARSLGGTHDPENLILACDGCHAAHHRGLIAIGGAASQLIVRRKHELAYDMVANDETSGASIELDPSAHVSTSSSLPLGTEPASEPSAHVSTNISHTFNAAVARSRERDALAKQGTRHEPSAHVSTNASHAIDAVVMHSEDGIRSTSDGQGHEPSAHVSTNSGHVIDAAITRSCERDAPTNQTSELELSAHVSKSESPSASRPTRFEQERIRTQARMALVTLGYRSGEAGKAVDLAIRNGYDTLETVIREALRSCIRSS